MKKFSLLFIIVLLFASICYSQSLKILYNNQILTNNYVIDTTGLPSELFTIPLKLKNIAASSKQIKVKKIIHLSVNGSENSFCFAGQCFDSSVYISPIASTIDPNSIDSSFTGDYCGNGKIGTTSLTYVFFDVNNSSDSVAIKINFTTQNDVKLLSKQDIRFSNAYPNPASNSTSFEYNILKQYNSAYIRFSDILGSKVLDVAINDYNGKKTVDLSNFKKGIYFYSLVINDVTYLSRKLIVK